MAGILFLKNFLGEILWEDFLGGILWDKLFGELLGIYLLAKILVLSRFCLNGEERKEGKNLDP